MQTIAFYSYKGGTGRSLVVANVARYLAQFGQSVVAIDLDLEAPGLHYKLEINDQHTSNKQCKGIVDYIHTLIAEGKKPSSISDYLCKVKQLPNEQGQISLFPAGSAPSVSYWKKLSEINWHEWFYLPEAKGVQLFLELKELIREEIKPDFLLIDSRTGITEISSAATTILPEKIVCLFLPNRENLEGIRTILRSFRKTPRIPEQSLPIEVIPVLARIPADYSGDTEQDLIKSIKKYLNEPAEELKDTLSIEDIFVLHSEPELQVSESLRVGGTKSPDESILLRDYLRLFAVLIPPEIVMPRVEPLIMSARNKAFDDPDASQKTLESLTQLGHPEVYRELLRFYRLRNASGEIILRTAQRLWELKRTFDPILWQAIRNNFKKVRPEEKKLPYTLEMIEGAWRSAGANDVEIGCELAESYDDFNNALHAAEILGDLIRQVGSNERAVSICLRLLNNTNSLREGELLIEDHRNALANSPKFITQWARHMLARDDNKYLSELTSPPLISILFEARIDVLIRTLLKADKLAESLDTIAKYIRKRRISPMRLSDELEPVYRSYVEIGQIEELEQVIRKSYPGDADDVEEALKALRRSQRRRVRYSDL
jgi:MinD-like ATPase involved in chromosome partitioning or flagellar assembly